MSEQTQPAGSRPVERPVGRPANETTVYRWLVEEFDANGNSTGRYMLDHGDLTITANAHEARKFRGMRTAMFRAEDMRAKHGGDWRHTHHGFMAPANVLA